MLFIFVCGVAVLAIARTLCSMWCNYEAAGRDGVGRLFGIEMVSSVIGGCVAWLLCMASLVIGSPGLGRVCLVISSFVLGMVVVPSVGESLDIGARQGLDRASRASGLTATALLVCATAMVGFVLLGGYLCVSWSGVM